MTPPSVIPPSIAALEPLILPSTSSTHATDPIENFTPEKNLMPNEPLSSLLMLNTNDCTQSYTPKKTTTSDKPNEISSPASSISSPFKKALYWPSNIKKTDSKKRKKREHVSNPNLHF